MKIKAEKFLLTISSIFYFFYSDTLNFFYTELLIPFSGQTVFEDAPHK